MADPHVIERKIEEVTHRLIERAKRKHILIERGEDIGQINKDIAKDKTELIRNIRMLK